MVWDPRNVGAVHGGAPPRAFSGGSAPSGGYGSAAAGAANAGGSSYGQAMASQPQQIPQSTWGTAFGGAGSGATPGFAGSATQPTSSSGRSAPAVNQSGGVSGTATYGSGGAMASASSGYDPNGDGTVTPVSWTPEGGTVETGAPTLPPWEPANFVANDGTRIYHSGNTLLGDAVTGAAIGGFFGGAPQAYAAINALGGSAPAAGTPFRSPPRASGPEATPVFSQPVAYRAPAAVPYADPRIGFSAPATTAAPAQRYADPKINFNAPPPPMSYAAHMPGATYSARGQG